MNGIGCRSQKVTNAVCAVVITRLRFAAGPPTTKGACAIGVWDRRSSVLTYLSYSLGNCLGNTLHFAVNSFRDLLRIS